LIRAADWPSLPASRGLIQNIFRILGAYVFWGP
jgi:hypothetical protein